MESCLTKWFFYYFFFLLWQDCLKCFFQQDILTWNNQIQCSWCGTKQDATVKATITKAPQIIIFHLKRYSLYGVGHGHFLGFVRHHFHLHKRKKKKKSLQMSIFSIFDIWKLNGQLQKYTCQTSKLHSWNLRQGVLPYSVLQPTKFHSLILGSLLQREEKLHRGVTDYRLVQQFMWSDIPVNMSSWGKWERLWLGF